MPEGSPRFFKQAWFALAIVSLLAFIAVLSQLNPEGSNSALLDAPGISIDESFNVRQGYLLAEALSGYGLGFLDPRTQLEVSQLSLNDHPPLGRWWIGLSEKLASLYVNPIPNGPDYSIACARTGPAMAFAILVFLIGLFTTKWYGRTAGIIAAISVVLMPRVFGHAHLASLESFINLTYAAVILSVAHSWNTEQPPQSSYCLLDGDLVRSCTLIKSPSTVSPDSDCPLGHHPLAATCVVAINIMGDSRTGRLFCRLAFPVGGSRQSSP